MRAIFAIAFAVTCMSSSYSSERMMFGGYDCGEWFQKGEQRSQAETWLLGYMSGLNASGVRKKDAFEKVSALQMLLWMDNYCKANPLKTVQQGGNRLMFELTAR